MLALAASLLASFVATYAIVASGNVSRTTWRTAGSAAVFLFTP